jgi:ABC-type transporter Mla maintaining outer membrane lipid asymmetry ATPase subunit MlaF
MFKLEAFKKLSLARLEAFFARALAAQPEAILYDEPTTMVDPPTSEHVGDLIRRLKEQLRLTSVVVTHTSPPTPESNGR